MADEISNEFLREYSLAPTADAIVPWSWENRKPISQSELLVRGQGPWQGGDERVNLFPTFRGYEVLKTPLPPPPPPGPTTTKILTSADLRRQLTRSSSTCDGLRAAVKTTPEIRLTKALIRRSIGATQDRLADAMRGDDRDKSNLVGKKKMKIKSIREMPGLYYALDTYLEKRIAMWSEPIPYKGGLIEGDDDVISTAATATAALPVPPPPSPWSFPLSAPAFSSPKPITHFDSNDERVADFIKSFETKPDNVARASVPGTTLLFRCWFCDAKGCQTCSECRGSTIAECDACDGEGGEFCISCSGLGYYTRYHHNAYLNVQESRRETCFRCRGTGRKECNRCVGRGEITCKECIESSGIRLCAACRGFRAVKFRLEVEATFEIESDLAWLKRPAPMPDVVVVKSAATALPSTPIAADNWRDKIRDKIPQIAVEPIVDKLDGRELFSATIVDDDDDVGNSTTNQKKEGEEDARGDGVEDNDINHHSDDDDEDSDRSTNIASIMAEKGAEMAARQQRRFAEAGAATDSRIHRRVHRLMGVPAAEICVAWRDQRRLKCWIFGERKKCHFPDYPLSSTLEEVFLFTVTCCLYDPYN